VQERFLWQRRHSRAPSRARQQLALAGKSLEWNRYTNLKEIDRTNVAQLKPSWTFKIDDDG
jgi:glucose dehydrogenase